MITSARRVVYEGNEDRNKRTEEYRRIAWDCGKEEGRREERERFERIIEAEKSVCHYDSGDICYDVWCETAYERACNDILAALEEKDA